MAFAFIAAHFSHARFAAIAIRLREVGYRLYFAAYFAFSRFLIVLFTHLRYFLLFLVVSLRLSAL
jgi:hypothetical protein